MTELADQTVTVLDIVSRAPIAGANVTIGGVTVTTDENGVATFPSPTPTPAVRRVGGGKVEMLGSSTVTVTADWYFPSTVTFSGDSVEVDLWPYSLPIAIGAVVTLGAICVVGAKVSGWF